MKIEEITLPKDADLRMVVAAILTTAACNLNLPPAEAEETVCALYERILTVAEKAKSEKDMKDWEGNA